MPPSPEELARQNIDAVLTQCGWKIQSRAEINLSAGRGVAITEGLLKGGGEVDYLLFVGKAIGTVEAMPEGFTLTAIGVDDAELTKLLLRAGDLLIIEGNGSKDQIGCVAAWNGSIQACVHQNHIIKVRPTLRVLSEWILNWLRSPGGRHLVEVVASSTSGLCALSVNKVGDLPMPLPIIAEQERVISKVERKETFVERSGHVVGGGLGHSIRLRESSLRHGITGKR